MKGAILTVNDFLTRRSDTWVGIDRLLMLVNEVSEKVVWSNEYATPGELLPQQPAGRSVGHGARIELHVGSAWRAGRIGFESGPLFLKLRRIPHAEARRGP
jgi:hypothetical protein